ncbi:proteasome assembly chaperone family protein, partial [Methanosalsum natronophilum]
IEIYSPHFPPQVIVNDDNTIRLVNNEIHLCKLEDRDILILVGDHQSSSTDGHYELCGIYLDIAESMQVNQIYTLGGFPTGQLNYKDEVICAVNNSSMVDELKESGVVFKKGEPGGGIVGASGLILGLSHFRNIDAACLMGKTSGYIVDPKSSQSLLKILSALFNFEVDLGPLEERAKEMEKIVAKLMEKEQQKVMQEDDLTYIG